MSMSISRKWLMVLPVAAVAMLALGAVSGDAAKSKKAGKRTVYLSAAEWKGSATVAEEPFPTSRLPSGPEGSSYGLKAPDATGKWEVETYRFDTPVITALEGEKVTLKIFGVNGKLHPVMLPDFYGERAFQVKRGELTTIRFRAKKAGIYEMHCHIHLPAMVADIVVLPRPA